MAEKKNPEAPEKPKNEIAKRTASEQFLDLVKNKYASEMSTAVVFDDFHRRLVMNLFQRADLQLKYFEQKRLEKANAADKLPYTWANVDTTKLALATIDKINLGLDASIPNHLHIIAYMDNHTGKYTLDIRPGYEGIKHYRMAAAAEEDRPKDVRLELVYSNDEFEPLMKDANNEIESYRFKIVKPFDRGTVVGGFGYLVMNDATKNKLVIVTKADFDASKKKAQTMDFWGPYETAMQYKTLVTKVMKKVPISPKTAYLESIMRVEAEDEEPVDRVQETIAAKSNATRLSFAEAVDVESIPVDESAPPEEPEF